MPEHAHDALDLKDKQDRTTAGAGLPEMRGPMRAIRLPGWAVDRRWKQRRIGRLSGRCHPTIIRTISALQERASDGYLKTTAVERIARLLAPRRISNKIAGSELSAAPDVDVGWSD